MNKNRLGNTVRTNLRTKLKTGTIQARAAAPITFKEKNALYYTAWCLSQHAKDKASANDITTDQFRNLSPTDSFDEDYLTDETTDMFEETRDKTNYYLDQCAKIFNSKLPNGTTAKNAQEFKKANPNVEKNAISLYHKDFDQKFSFQRGMKEAMNFYQHNGLFATYQGYRDAIPHRPIFFSPLGVYSWTFQLSRHYNDTFWNGFLETAFYVGAKCPIIDHVDGYGEIEPSHHSNPHVRYQLMILKIMDRVRESAGQEGAFKTTDPTDRTHMICATYHQLILDSARPNTNQHALVMSQGHNPITCMLRMIQKNHHLIEEILNIDERNGIPFQKDLANALIHFRPSRVKLDAQGEPKINHRWYESWGLKYERAFKHLKAYKEKASQDGQGKLYIIPKILLSILLWLLPDPEIWRIEGRLSEFGLDHRGLERIALSAKALYQHNAQDQLPWRTAYLSNFTSPQP